MGDAGSAEGFELVMVETDGSTSALPLPNGLATIGSSAECSVLLSDPSVAPLHAELIRARDGVLWIRDRTGKKQTFVNGHPVDSAPVEDGAFIKLGLVDLCLRAKTAESGQHGTLIRQSQPAIPAMSPPRPRVSGSGVKDKDDPWLVAPRPSPTQVKQRSYPPAAQIPSEDLAPSSTDSAITAGMVIADRYKILGKLAEGGMGEVYKAVHIELEKAVAVKVMKRSLADDPGFADRFKREAIAASRIGQQNICDVTDFGRTAGGRFYFVMEFLEGETLGHLIRRRGALPISQAIGVMTQLCRALTAAHHVNIVHRDLKPENVMLLQRPGQQDFVKVLDFGVAKIRATGTGEGTQVGMVVGTPQYMAPEQASGLPVDARTDVYALGLIFHEMLLGKPTFTDDTPGLLMAAQIYRAPPPLLFGSGDPMPEHLQELVGRMLAKVPNQRPQTMEEVLGGLLEVSARLMDPIARLATPALTPPLRPSQALLDGTRPGPSVIHPLTPDRPITQAAAPSGGAAPVVTVAGPASAVDAEALGAGGNRKLAIGGAAVVLIALLGAWLAFRSPAPPAVVELPLPPLVPVVVKPEPVKPEPVKPEPVAPTAQALKLSLTTVPPNAQVLMGDAVIGTTPLELSWEKGKVGAFSFQLAGHVSEARNIAPQADLKLEIALKPTPKAAKPKKDTKSLLDDPYGEPVKDLQDNPY